MTHSHLLMFRPSAFFPFFLIAEPDRILFHFCVGLVFSSAANTVREVCNPQTVYLVDLIIHYMFHPNLHRIEEILTWW